MGKNEAHKEKKPIDGGMYMRNRLVSQSTTRRNHIGGSRIMMCFTGRM
jgi:hypothetical protein